MRPLVNEWAKWIPELDNTAHTTVTDEIDVSAGEPVLLLKALTYFLLFDNELLSGCYPQGSEFNSKGDIL